MVSVVLTKEMQEKLYDYVMKHCNTSENASLIRSLKKKQKLFTDFDLLLCLQLIGLENIRPENLSSFRTIGPSFFPDWESKKIVNLSDDDAFKIDQSLRGVPLAPVLNSQSVLEAYPIREVEVKLDATKFEHWARKLPTNLSALNQLLDFIGIQFQYISLTDNNFVIKLNAEDSSIYNKNSEEMLQFFDQVLEEKKINSNIESAMQKAIQTLKKLNEPNIEKKFDELEQIKQDFHDVSNRFLPLKKTILQEIKNFIHQAALPVNYGKYADNEVLKTFFKNLEPDDLKQVASCFDGKFQNMTHYQEFQDSLQQQPQAFNANFLQAMVVATNRWFVGGEEKFKELEKLKENFKQAIEANNDINNTLISFLLKAAQPRQNLLTSQFGETKTCTLFFQSLNEETKKQLFTILGKSEIKHPSLKDFAELLRDKAQKSQVLMPKNN